MRRPRHILLIASLLLLATTLIMGVRSMLVVDRWYIATRDGGVWKIDSIVGRVSIERYRNWPSPPIRRHTTFTPHLYYSPPFMNYRSNGVEDYGPFIRATGRAVVAVKADGTVDWETYHPLTPGSDPPKTSHAMTYSCVFIPHWTVLVFFAVLPIAKVIALIVGRIARRWRRARGLCPDCGYDLRETPERCPECGATPLPAQFVLR